VSIGLTCSARGWTLIGKQPPPSHPAKPHRLAVVIRLRGALMLEQNYEWVVCRRYVSLESIAGFSHGAFIGLPGVVA